MNYGVPYKGSKNIICNKLAEAIPAAENFYDLFAGGCAVTHKMMVKGCYLHYHANDLDGQGLRLFADSVAGKYRDERRWISREDFLRLKDTDPYVSCCWSFGNNQKSYLYAREIEPWKKALHYAIVFGDFSLFRALCPDVCDACIGALEGIEDTHERRLKFGKTVVDWAKTLGTVERTKVRTLVEFHKKDGRGPQCHFASLERLQRLQRLQRLERLERLERLQRLERLETSFKSYDEVEIRPDSIIYCDPPYRGTNAYKNAFDHERFYDWCERQKELVLVSEYGMPEERFTEVWSTAHNSRLSATANNKVVERLFVPTGQLAKYRAMMQGRMAVQLELFPETKAYGKG